VEDLATKRCYPTKQKCRHSSLCQPGCAALYDRTLAFRLCASITELCRLWRESTACALYADVRTVCNVQTILRVALLLLATTTALAQERSPAEVYGQRIEEARALYRRAIAEQIRHAQKVEIVLLRFDDLRKIDPSEDLEGRFPVAPYEATTSVISTIVFDSSQANELLLALAEQIEKREHNSHLLCHLPTHGVRVYSDEPTGEPFDSKLIYSGSFSWVCRTFSFTYPDSSEWLDTNRRLMLIFSRFLPIPKGERDRLNDYRGVETDTGRDGNHIERREPGGSAGRGIRNQNPGGTGNRNPGTRTDCGSISKDEGEGTMSPRGNRR